MVKLDVRALNNEGLKKFRDYIKKTRESEKTTKIILPYPVYMLDNDKFLSKTEYNVKVAVQKKFTNRYEFGKYLVEKFKEGGKSASYDDQGLWGWLALAYFQQLRKTTFTGKKGNKTATQRDEHFVPSDWNKQGAGKPDDYRHSVRSIFMLVEKFGTDAKFYVSKSGMASWGDVAEQMLSEKKVISNKGLRELIYDLYRDDNGFAKTGTANKRPNAKDARIRKAHSSTGYGKMRRLTDDYLPRINLTYDVGGMDAERLKKIIGDEFA
jgi:hypothetical protein